MRLSSGCRGYSLASKVGDYNNTLHNNDGAYPNRAVCTLISLVTCFHGLLWSLYGIGQTIIFSSCGFFLSIYLSSSFFRRLISAAAHWMSTIPPHMVWH